MNQAQTLIQNAVLNDDPDTLEEVLRVHGVRRDAVDASNQCKAFNCLHVAIVNSKIRMTRLLLQYGVSADRRTDDGKTCLHLAVLTGDVNMVELFVRTNEVNALNNDGVTPLHMATKYNSYEVVEFLLRNEATPNSRQVTNGNTPLHDAVSHKNMPIIELLLNWGADPNCENWKNDTPLQYAMMHLREVRFFDLFLRHGALVEMESNNRKDYGTRTLRYATKYSNYEVLEKLLKIRVDLNKFQLIDATIILHLVIENNVNPEEMIISIVNLLARYFDADLNLSDNELRTPLFKAVLNNRFKLAKHLLSEGVSVDGTLKYRPIVAAVENGDFKMIQLLVAYGAMVNVRKISNGSGLLHVALERISDADVRYKVIELLLDNGTYVDDKNKNNASALHLAVLARDLQVVNLLVDRRANVNLKNVAGNTPLYFAITCNFHEAAKTLMERGASIDGLLLHVVCRRDLKMVKILWENCVDTDYNKIELESSILVEQGLLDLVVTTAYIDIIEYFLELGADINVKYENELPLRKVLSNLGSYLGVDIELYNSVAKILIRHAALLETQDFTIDEENLKAITDAESWVNDYYKNCQDELKEMKVTNICAYSNVKYFDILSKCGSDLIECLRENLPHELQPDDFNKFENYGDKVRAKYESGIQLLKEL